MDSEMYFTARIRGNSHLHKICKLLKVCFKEVECKM